MTDPSNPGSSTTPRWAWIFLDCPEADAPAAWAWWAERTGTRLSPTRGAHGEFATLVPADGDPWVKVQATQDGPPGVHLDLEVVDVQHAAVAAEGLGATRVDAIGDTVVLLRSLGGFGFCLTTAGGSNRRQDRIGRTLLDQVMLDVPSGIFDAELAFWSALTGWPNATGSGGEFGVLTRPGGIPVRLLLQRVGHDGPVTGHVDLACADRAAAVADHEAAGAQVQGEGPRWTVLRDPFGRPYCLTDRDPVTGMLPEAGPARGRR